MARKRQSNLSTNIHNQIRGSLSEQQQLQHQLLNKAFLAKLENLMQRLQWQSSLQETSMLMKMKLAQVNGETLSADIAKAFISDVVAEKQGRQAFKELTMLTQWYQESLMDLQKKTAQTRVLLVDKNGTIEISSFESSVEQPERFSFSDIFTVSKSAQSKGGGLKAKYRSSFKHLQGREGFSLETITKEQRGDLENVYFEAIRRANAMKRSFIDPKTGKQTRIQLGTGSLIPVETAKGIRYYNLSSLGDLNEAYLRLRAQKGSFMSGASNEEKLLQLLNATHQVDNASALLKGDFRIGKQEISAKSKGASAFGVSQVIDYIYGLKSLVSGGQSRTQVYKDFNQFSFQQQENPGGKYTTTQPEFEIPESVIKARVDELFKSAQWTPTI